MKQLSVRKSKVEKQRKKSNKPFRSHQKKNSTMSRDIFDYTDKDKQASVEEIEITDQAYR